jgi:hypothetical protein
MTTSELQQLIDWLGSISDGSVSKNRVYFTERDLEFTVDDSRTTVHVHVFHDFLPPWLGAADSVTIEFPVECIRFDRVIESLRRQLAQFPGKPPARYATERSDERES